MALGGDGYWHSGYWHQGYWETNYWAESGAASIGVVATVLRTFAAVFNHVRRHGR